ncbi:MAG: class II histone deacetylase [Intrasporangium sp.]|uniref:class II histone deacetylase n=1 Tax=Intrasporangium sp. TaxID=1925024 RepID=UPI003F7E7BBB
MRTGWLWHEIYAWHDTGNAAGYLSGPGLQPFRHFESPESKARLASLVEVSGMLEHLTRVTATPASEQDLLRVHTDEHVESMRRQSEDPRGGDMGDGLSPFAQGGYDIARWAAGGTISAIKAVVTGEVDNAYALVRPPGHHARPDTGMGFCMFANIAIGIEYARQNLGVGRVAVVDWDVHHGNGTEACFENDPEVLTISLHQNGNFPADTGKVEHRGTGDGFGAAINIPLPAGSGDGAYQYALEHVVAPALRRFAPDLIIVACGFDSSNADPLGKMLLTSTSYSAMTNTMMELAEELCEGKLVISHEGGYSPVYVPFCGLAVLETLSGQRSGINDPYAATWDALPDQALAPAQKALVDRVATLVDEVPSPATSTLSTGA